MKQMQMQTAREREMQSEQRRAALDVTGVCPPMNGETVAITRNPKRDEGERADEDDLLYGAGLWP